MGKKPPQKSAPKFAHARLIAALIATLLATPAQAGLIRDAEIEATLAAYSRPIFEAADIPPNSVRLFIVENPEVNAYVAGGLNIFINTGLLRQASKPGMLIGVIAHETGHIAGAHLAQFRDKSTRATIGSVLGILAGAAIAAGGNSQAGIGVIAGSQNVVGREFLSEIRLNESSADQAALRFLDASDISATGALDMFLTLKRLEGGDNTGDPFLRSHPLTSERISAMRHHIEESKIPPDQVPAGFADRHARTLAKLIAFTEPYDTVLAIYPARDTSFAGRYARAIADFRRSQLQAALRELDGLIRERPGDGYLYELRGQMLFENGKLDAAAAAYAKAVSLLPKSPLILTDYAKTLLALGDDKKLTHAMLLLEQSRDLDDTYSLTWRQLAIGYGRQGHMGQSYAALGEEAALEGDFDGVLKYVARARSYSGTDSATALELDDLEREARAQREKKKSLDIL